MRIIILLLFTIISNFVISQTNSFIDTVQRLDTSAEKEKFLKQVWEDDQSIRNKWSTVELSDNDSLKFRVWKEYVEVDSLNFLKVEAYLKVHGYPSADNGGFQSQTPWLIIHHAGENDIRFQYFPLLLEAFREKNLHQEPFLGYVTRAITNETEEAFHEVYVKDIEVLIKQMEVIRESKTIEKD